MSQATATIAGRIDVAVAPSEREIEQWVVGRVDALLEEEGAVTNAQKPLAAYGLDSVDTAGLLSDLEDWLGVALPTELVWEWVSPRELATRVAAHLHGE